MDWITLVMLAVVTLFAAVQLIPFWRARKQRGRPVPDLGDFLNADQAAQPQLLFYFWSPACHACAGVSRIIDALQQQRDDIIKVDATAHPEVARAFAIMATPSLVLVRDGVIRQIRVGAKSERTIRTMLESQGNQ